MDMDEQRTSSTSMVILGARRRCVAEKRRRGFYRLSAGSHVCGRRVSTEVAKTGGGWPDSTMRYQCVETAPVIINIDGL